MLLSEFEGRRVGILGAGREGRAVRNALRERFPDQAVTVFSETPLDDDEASDPVFAGDEFLLGPLDGEVLSGFDVLVRSPGVSPYREALQGLNRVRFTTASNIWFAENPLARTICITGTKGKSTTTAMAAHLLRAAGFNAIAAGNIGHPMLELEAVGVDWWVIELSSYQLCDLQARPVAAAVLNLSEDHLDWHGGSKAYRDDKLRLADMVGAGSLTADHADESLRDSLAGHPGVRWFNHADGWRVRGDRVCHAGRGTGFELPQLPGRHNLNNLAAALTLCDMVSALPADPAAALSAFEGLPHRLHTIGCFDGLRFVDDSLSTTPVATLAALRAFAGEKVTLLVGGKDRGLDWAAMAPRFLEQMPHAVIALPDNGPHIISELESAGLDVAGGMHSVEDLQSAVSLAREITPADGVVLLSPGAPSFPVFRDYRERGRAFAQAAGKKRETAGQG